MSHDIGALRGLADDIERANMAVHHAKHDLKMAAERALFAEFGKDRDTCFGTSGSRAFHRVVGNRRWVVCVDFPERGTGWRGRAGEAGAERAGWHIADSPRAAMAVALAALALTHPNEAAALAAVIPEAP
jgi:hypothetical protein